MSDNSVLISIRGDISDISAKLADLKGYIGKVKDETQSMASSGKSVLGELKQSWIAVTAAVAAAMYTIKQAWDSAKMGAIYAEQEGILNNLSKKYSTTATSIVAEMAKASGGMIANSDLMQIALAGIAKGMSPDQMIKLAGAAELLGKTVGKDATVALRELSEALESGQAKALKGYAGTTIDLTTTFGDLAKKMTGAEKALAMYLVIMIHATQLQKEQTVSIDSAADKMERLETKYKNAMLTIETYSKTAFVWIYNVIKNMSLIPDKMATTGPGVYVVPPIDSGKTDPMAEYKAQREALKKILQARKDDADAIKDGGKVLKTQMDENKKTYEKEIEMADHAVKMKVLAGENELNYTLGNINTKEKALNKFYDANEKAINDSLVSETVKKAKLDELWADYDKNWQKYEDQRAEQTVKVNEFIMQGKQSYFTWERKQLDDQIEYERTKGGERRKVTEAEWDAMRDYKRMTGQKMTQDQANDAELTLSRFKETYVGGTLSGLQEISDAAGNVGKQMTDATKRAFDGMTDSLTEFVMTGKTDFASMVNSIIRDLIRIQIQSQITGRLSGWFSGLFGGGGSGGGGNPGIGDINPGPIEMHSGGIVNEARIFRIVPGAEFANAPRYHGGIGPGEKAAIIRDNEGVFTPGQMKAMGLRSGQSQPISITVKLDNNTGTPAQASRSNVKFDGQGYVVSVVLDAIARNVGGLRDVFTGR